jgi:hypothetical protein
MTKLANLKNGGTDREKINLWLDSVGEFDKETRGEVLEQCKNDKDARNYYLSRYEEMK